MRSGRIRSHHIPARIPEGRKCCCAEVEAVSSVFLEKELVARVQEENVTVLAPVRLGWRVGNRCE